MGGLNHFLNCGTNSAWSDVEGGFVPQLNVSKETTYADLQ